MVEEHDMLYCKLGRTVFKETLQQAGEINGRNSAGSSVTQGGTC